MKAALVISCVIVICVADLQDYMLGRHNTDRRRHNAGDLTTNDELVEIAQICAEHNARRDDIEHDCPQSQKYGENLHWDWRSDASPDADSAAQRAYDGWYKESKDYDYKTGQSTGGAVGHFTQIVWKSTTEVGCAAAQNTSAKSTIVACVYNPQGNLEGDETNQVEEPSSK